MTASRPGNLANLHKAAAADRKSTRLNSSHSQISYAVFCLKKKNKSESTREPVSAYSPPVPIHLHSIFLIPNLPECTSRSRNQRALAQFSSHITHTCAVSG